MLEFFTRRYSLLILSGFIMLAMLLGYPQTAAADKKPLQPVIFDPPEINVAAIYETTAESQQDAMSAISKSSRTLYKKNPGFDGFVVLKSQDGDRVIVLSQWKDLASYQAYAEQPPVEDYKSKYADAYKSKYTPPADYKSKFAESYKSKFAPPVEDYKAKYADSKSSRKSKGKETAATLEPSKTIIFEQEKTEPSSLVAAIRQESLVQLSQYTIKDPESESEVLDFVEKLSLTADDMVPSPRSVVLLRSDDDAEVALLASWSCSADLEGVETPPSFAELPEALMEAADNEQHLYGVLRIIPPPPPVADAS